MHNGIPWWLVLLLNAIHFWPVTLLIIGLLAAGVWFYRKRK